MGDNTHALEHTYTDMIHANSSGVLEEYAHSKAHDTRASIEHEEAKLAYERATEEYKRQLAAEKAAQLEEAKERTKRPIALTMETAPTTLLKRPHKEIPTPARPKEGQALASVTMDIAPETNRSIQTEEALDNKRVYYTEIISQEPSSISTPAENKGITSTKL